MTYEKCIQTATLQASLACSLLAAAAEQAKLAELNGYSLDNVRALSARAHAHADTSQAFSALAALHAARARGVQ